MKKKFIPGARRAVFDSRAISNFLTCSTMDVKGREKMKWTDGKEYPVIRIEVSSESPRFTRAKPKIMDTAGRIDKFRQRHARTTGARRCEVNSRIPGW